MEFEIKLDYTMDDLQAYWQGIVQKKSGQKPPEAASPKQMLWLGVFFVAAGILTAAVMQGVLMSLLEIVLGVMLLIASWRCTKPRKAGYSRWVRKMWKKYQESGALYNCCFTEDGVWIHDSKSDHRYDYSALEALWEDEAHFYLVLSATQGAYILRRASFVRGTPEDLPAYWQERAGKLVKRITESH